MEEKILLQLIGIDYDLSTDAVTVRDLKLAGPVLNTARAVIN